MPGATVTATNVGTGTTMTAKTNSAGVYNFSSIDPGIYKVEGEMRWFQTEVFKDVQIGNAMHLRLNFTLLAQQSGGDVTDDDLSFGIAFLDRWLFGHTSSSGNPHSETKMPEPPAVSPGKTSPPRPKEIAAEIKKLLPAGWTCTLIFEQGKMGYPHGLKEPLFRIDFINTDVTFPAGIQKGKYLDVNPNLRLHFHAIAEREEVLKTIRAEMVYSWDVPIKFTETKDYIIVTSPLWKNHYTEEVGGTTWAIGDSSDAANRALRPLLEALKKYFDARK